MASSRRDVSQPDTSTPVDPRFAEVVAALAKDSEFAAVVAAYYTDLASGNRKFGAGGLKVNGKLFAMVSRDRLVVKLPRIRVESLVSERKGVPFDPGHGRKMKEWLSVNGAALPWLDLVREAYAFVGGAQS